MSGLLKRQPSQVAVLVDDAGASRINSNWEELWALGEGWQETYHNDVFMLLGRQVCVLQDGTQKAGGKQKKTNKY